MDEILNIKENTNKKIEQTLEQFEKKRKKKKLGKLSYKSFQKPAKYKLLLEANS